MVAVMLARCKYKRNNDDSKSCNCLTVRCADSFVQTACGMRLNIVGFGSQTAVLVMTLRQYQPVQLSYLQGLHSHGSHSTSNDLRTAVLKPSSGQLSKLRSARVLERAGMAWPAAELPGECKLPGATWQQRMCFQR